MNQLLLGSQRLRFVPLGNRRRKIPSPVMRHAQGELGVKVSRVRRQHRPQAANGAGKLTPAEIEHRVVVAFLQIHASPPR